MENKNNKRKVPKMTYSVALKETFNGAMAAITSGEVFKGLKLINKNIVDRVKKVFNIKADEVIMVEARPHLNIALYTSILSIIISNLLLLVIDLPRGVTGSITTIMSLLGVLAISFLFISLIYMGVANNKVWKTWFVKFLIILTIISIVRYALDLLGAFEALRLLKYGFSRIGRVSLLILVSVVSNLLLMYYNYMILYGLTYAKGGRKVAKVKEETLNIIDDSSTTETENIEIEDNSSDDIIDIFEEEVPTYEAPETKEVPKPIETATSVVTSGISTILEDEKDNVEDKIEEIKTKFCSNCGNKLNIGVSFCSECGAKVN